MKKLKAEGQILAKAFSRELGLSEDTIRRDLRELAEEGLLQRVHGGALPASLAIADFAGRERLGSEAKRAIGKAAANLVKPDQIVVLDGGTTTRELARHLPTDLRATVVTHSPTIAIELVSHPEIEVILIGGRLFKHSVVALGAAAVEAVSRIRADVYFMGITGIHPTAGLSTGDMEEAYMKRMLSKAAAETIVLVSAEKFNTASAFMISPVTEASALVVEESIYDRAVAAYEKLGLSIVRA